MCFLHHFKIILKLSKRTEFTLNYTVKKGVYNVDVKRVLQDENTYMD